MAAALLGTLWVQSRLVWATAEAAENPFECLGSHVGEAIHPSGPASNPPASGTGWVDPLPFWERTGFGHGLAGRRDLLADMLCRETGVSTTLADALFDLCAIDDRLTELWLAHEREQATFGHMTGPTPGECRNALNLRRERDQAIRRMELLAVGARVALDRWQRETRTATDLCDGVEQQVGGWAGLRDLDPALGSVDAIRQRLSRNRPARHRFYQEVVTEFGSEARALKERVVLEKVLLLLKTGTQRRRAGPRVAAGDPAIASLKDAIVADVLALEALRQRGRAG